MNSQSDSCKPPNFDGKIHFRRWKQQAEFLLYTLGLHTALFPDSGYSDFSHDNLRRLSISTIKQTSSSSTSAKNPEEIDFQCLNRIFTILSDRLYDKYFDFKTAKGIWLALEKEYVPNDATRISHLSIEFENYKMVD